MPASLPPFSSTPTPAGQRRTRPPLGHVHVGAELHVLDSLPPSTSALYDLAGLKALRVDEVLGETEVSMAMGTQDPIRFLVSVVERVRGLLVVLDDTPERAARVLRALMERRLALHASRIEGECVPVPSLAVDWPRPANGVEASRLLFAPGERLPVVDDRGQRSVFEVPRG